MGVAADGRESLQAPRWGSEGGRRLPWPDWRGKGVVLGPAEGEEAATSEGQTDALSGLWDEMPEWSRKPREREGNLS